MEILIPQKKFYIGLLKRIFSMIILENVNVKHYGDVLMQLIRVSIL